MVHESLQQKQDYSHSRFYKWRCITSMAHADGVLHEQEVEYLESIFQNMLKSGALTQEAYETLQKDIQKPQPPFEMLIKINDPAYRAQVIYFARLLAHKDGEAHPSEQQLLEKLHFAVVEGMDIEAIREEVRYNVQEQLVLHEIEADSSRPTTGISGLIDQLALQFEIDLMD